MHLMIIIICCGQQLTITLVNVQRLLHVFILYSNISTTEVIKMQ